MEISHSPERTGWKQDVGIAVALLLPHFSFVTLYFCVPRNITVGVKKWAFLQNFEKEACKCNKDRYYASHCNK